MKKNGLRKMTFLVLGILLYAGTMTGWAQTSYTYVSVEAGKMTGTTVPDCTTITNLTVTGNIDARDIQFICDSIPNLEELDLSGATIAEYIGTVGNRSYSYTYPANEMLWIHNGGWNTPLLILLPQNLTSIASNAFYGCHSISFSKTSPLILPSTLTHIGSEAFAYCNITSVVVPASVDSMEFTPFDNCPMLEIFVDPANSSFTSEDGVLFNKNKTKLIQYPKEKEGSSYSIPSSVTDVGGRAFISTEKITSVVIPSSVTSIGEGTFWDAGLTSLFIPESVQSIGYQAFRHCPLSAISVDEANAYYAEKDGVLFNKDKTTLIQYPRKKGGNYIIPSSVATIESLAFDFADNLISITIPASVTTIEHYAFEGCSGLTSIIVFNPTPIPLAGDYFLSTDKSTCILYVPAGAKAAYEVAPIWQDFSKIIELTPHYTADSQSYPSTMTYTAVVVLDDVEWQSNLIEIGAFSGDECRGSVFVQQFSESTAHPYLGFLTVHGNSNEPITLRVYDHDTDKEYEATNAPVAFVADAIYGNSTEPYPIHLVSKQEIPLSEGWSWISVNMTNDEQPLIDQFKSNIGDAGVLLKGRNAFIQYPLWIGNLSEITNEDMYMVKTTTEQTLSFTGNWINPASAPISLLKGWNWIGYPSLVALPVNEALENLNPQVGDQIKSQLSYSTYTDGQGWIGTLENMCPGNGYMYYSNNTNPQTLTYPSSTQQPAPVMHNVYEETFASHWTVDRHRYPNTMTATSVVLSDNVELQSNAIEIGAFSGDECRGSVLLKNFPQVADSYLGFLVIHGDGNEEIQLRIYDHANGQEYDATNVLSFEVNAIHGNPAEPYRIVYSPTGINGIAKAGNIYLAQTGANLLIHRPWNVIDNLEITDLSGRVVLREANFAAESINVSSLVNSVYLLKLVKDNQVYVKKFIKQ